MMDDDDVLGRRFNPATLCYEAPDKRPIPAEHIRFPMSLVELLWILQTYNRPPVPAASTPKEPA